MKCYRCSTWNSEEEHRCHKCGQRLDGTPPQPVNVGAAALDIRVHEAQPVVPPQTPAPEVTRSIPFERARQASLFAMRDPQKVVSIGGEVEPRRNSARRRVEPGVSRRRRSAPPPPEQGTLEFNTPVHASPRRLRTEVEAVIYCDAPVASPTHRLVAGVIDLSLVLLATALFVFTVYLWSGSVVFAKSTLPYLAVVAASLAMLYEYVWCVANVDSPGLRWTGLRLLNFDGRAPQRRQRRMRMFGWCLSVSSVLGLVWALVDEEKLTWHDHISKTFPTYKR